MKPGRHGLNRPGNWGIVVEWLLPGLMPIELVLAVIVAPVLAGARAVSVRHHWLSRRSIGSLEAGIFNTSLFQRVRLARLWSET